MVPPSVPKSVYTKFRVEINKTRNKVTKKLYFNKCIEYNLCKQFIMKNKLSPLILFRSLRVTRVGVDVELNVD